MSIFRLYYHPMYEEAGGVPAIKEVRFSLTSSRGCFGECSFCALTFHQGRIVQARSHDSLVEEARAITDDPDFKGWLAPSSAHEAPAQTAAVWARSPARQ